MATTIKRGRFAINNPTVYYHRCSYEHCLEGATTIVRDTAAHWPTFKHGAGYVCEHHKAMALRGGCIEVKA